MAQTIGFGDLEEQGNQQNQQNQQQGGQPTTTPGAGQQGTATGASGQTAGNAGAGGQNLSQYKPQAYSQQGQGTGFVNLQQYLGANNPNQLQQTVAGGIENQNQSTLQNLGQAQQQFQQGTAANQANTAANQQLIQQVLANPAGFTNLGGTAAAAAQTAAGAPTQQALGQGNQFSQLMGGQYAGPSALGNVDQLTAQAQAAAQQAGNLTTAGGRQQVLQQLLGTPTYSSGEQGLDAALLAQGNPAALQQARSQALQLQGMVGQAAAGATAQGQEQASNAQQFGQQTQNQFGQTVSNLNAQLQQQAAGAQGQRNQQYQQLLSDAATGNLTQQEAQTLGLTGGEQVTSDILADIAAGKYSSESAQQATAQNTANAQQYATIDALRQLAGSNAPAAASQALAGYTGQEGQAGTWAAGPAQTVDTTGLGNRITGDVGAYTSANNWITSEEATGLNFKNWANGTLTPQDVQTAKSLGYTDQQLSDPMGRAMAGQALWNNYLDRTYAGTGGIGGNSRGLTTDYGNWAYSNAVQQGNLEAQRLQNEYGNLQNINITNPTPNATQGALNAMAQGTIINPNT